MEVVECFFNDVLVIKTKIFQDKRGSFRDYYSNKNGHCVHWSSPQMNFKFLENLDLKKIIISDKVNSFVFMTNTKCF